MVRMQLGCLFGVMLGMQMMAVRGMGVLCRILSVAFLVMLGGLSMVFSSVIVVLGGFLVMFGDRRCL